MQNSGLEMIAGSTRPLSDGGGGVPGTQDLFFAHYFHLSFFDRYFF